MASTFVAFAMGVQLVLLNLYLLGLGFHEDTVGQVAASISLGVAVGGIPAGFFYDRFSGKLSFIIATAGMMLTMFLLSLSNQKVLLVIWAFINGLAESMFFVSIFPHITEHSTPLERPYLYGMNMAVWSGFRIVGELVAGNLLGLWSKIIPNSSIIIQQRSSLMLAAGVGTLALIPLTQMQVRKTANVQRIQRNLLPNLGSRRSIFKAAFVLLLLGLVVGLTQPFYNVYFKRVFEAKTELIGLLFSISELLGLVSAFFIPFLIRHLGLLTGSSMFLMIAAPFILMVGIPFTFLFVAVMFLVEVGLNQIGNTPLMNLIMEVVPPNERGAMSGIRLITNYGAQALAGIAGGQIVLRFGYTWLFTLAAGIQVFTGVSIWFLFRGWVQKLETKPDLKW
jgi:MFS family permease